MKKVLILPLLLSALFLSGCSDPAGAPSSLPITPDKNNNIQVSKELEDCVNAADFKEEVSNEESDLYFKKKYHILSDDQQLPKEIIKEMVDISMAISDIWDREIKECFKKYRK